MATFSPRKKTPTKSHTRLHGSVIHFQPASTFCSVPLKDNSVRPGHGPYGFLNTRDKGDRNGVSEDRRV